MHTKKFYIPELEEWVVLKVSAHGLRNINKKGVLNSIIDASKKGFLK